MQRDRSAVAATLDGPERLVDVTFEAVDGEAVVHVTGELDHFTSPVLADGLARAVASDARLTVVDLERTSFVSLAGFRLLVDAADLLADRGSTMVVRRPPASLRILNGVVESRSLVLEEDGTGTGRGGVG